MNGACDVTGCRRLMILIYRWFPWDFKPKEMEVCDFHWGKHCDQSASFTLARYGAKMPKKGESSDRFFRRLKVGQIYYG